MKTVLALLVLTCAISAHDFMLYSGETIAGELAGISADSLQIQTGDTLASIARADVARISPTIGHPGQVYEPEKEDKFFIKDGRYLLIALLAIPVSVDMIQDGSDIGGDIGDRKTATGIIIGAVGVVSFMSSLRWP